MISSARKANIKNHESCFDQQCKKMMIATNLASFKCWECRPESPATCPHSLVTFYQSSDDYEVSCIPQLLIFVVLSSAQDVKRYSDVDAARKSLSKLPRSGALFCLHGLNYGTPNRQIGLNWWSRWRMCWGWHTMLMRYLETQGHGKLDQSTTVLIFEQYLNFLNSQKEYKLNTWM